MEKKVKVVKCRDIVWERDNFNKRLWEIKVIRKMRMIPEIFRSKTTLNRGKQPLASTIMVLGVQWKREKTSVCCCLLCVTFHYLKEATMYSYSRRQQ